MVKLKTPIEKHPAYATERRYEREPREGRRVPRLGGVAPLPALHGTGAVFSVHTDELSTAERAAPGWCLRLGVAAADVPSNSSFQFDALIAEVSVSNGGVGYTLEVNPYPGCTLHVVGEQVSARVRWADHVGLIEGMSGNTPIYPSQQPPDAELTWMVSRGLCATTAIRSFVVDEPTWGLVPQFATGFAVFSGDVAIDEDMRLQFADSLESSRILQHYTREDLLQVVGNYAPLPPGAGAWHWLQAMAEPTRLVFTYAERL